VFGPQLGLTYVKHVFEIILVIESDEDDEDDETIILTEELFLGP
jgi:hypothetical protein